MAKKGISISGSNHLRHTVILDSVESLYEKMSKLSSTMKGAFDADEKVDMLKKSSSEEYKMYDTASYEPSDSYVPCNDTRK